MNYARALFGFRSYSDPKLLNETSIILTYMNGNQNFTNPSPNLHVVETAYQNFQKKYETGKSGDRIKIAEKNTAREELLLIMRELCNYVNMAGKNVRAVLLSSGFKVSKETNEVQILGAIVGFDADKGLNKNEIKVWCERVSNAVSYVFVCTDEKPTPTTTWRTNTATTSQTVFDKLTKGVEYYFKVAVIGRNNQYLESDPISLICQ